MRPEDEAEFAGLVERQWAFAYRVAWAVLRHGADAEDAAQETFVKVLRAKAWRGLRDERAFVARAAWRTAVEHWGSRRRRMQRHADASGDGEGMAAVDRVADTGPGPEATLAAADQEALLQRLIDGLPEELRQPLALSVEMNSREIAAAIGLAEGTVRTRLMRARQMLREKMQALEDRHYARR